MQFIPSFPVALRKYPRKMNSVQSVLLCVTEDSLLNRCWLNGRTTSSVAGISCEFLSPLGLHRDCVWESSGVHPLAFAGPQDEGTAVFEMGAKVLGEGPWTC